MFHLPKGTPQTHEQSLYLVQFQVQQINSEFEGADNYIMYSLGKQLSEEESVS